MTREQKRFVHDYRVLLQSLLSSLALAKRIQSNANLVQYFSPSTRTLIERLARTILRQLPSLARLIIPRTTAPRMLTAGELYFELNQGKWTLSSWRSFLVEQRFKEPLSYRELSSALMLNALVILSNLARTERPCFLGKALSRDLLVQSLWMLRSHKKWQIALCDLSSCEPLLMADPGNAYPRMDIEGRALYQEGIARIACRQGLSEHEIARRALEFAEMAKRSGSSPPHASNIGFYLMDKGESRFSAGSKARSSLPIFYLAIRVVAALFLGFCFCAILSRDHPAETFNVVVFLSAFIMSFGSIKIEVERLLLKSRSPRILPRLALSSFREVAAKTLVAIPCLLYSKPQILGLIELLRRHWATVGDPDVHYALVANAPDSTQTACSPEAAELARFAKCEIEVLNARCNASSPFLLLHRELSFSRTERAFIGRERKRGKLHDLNQAILHERSGFTTVAGQFSKLHDMTYVLILDEDSVLTPSALQKLVATLSHPLNHPLVDRTRRKLAHGYCMVQPATGILRTSTASWRWAKRWISAQMDVDSRVRTFFHPFQTLFDEVPFGGKGLYHVSSLEALLSERIPPECILSHDIIESAFGRCGQVADTVLLESFPRSYDSLCEREYRWMRGEWQNLIWLLPYVKNEFGDYKRNQTSFAGRWFIVERLWRALDDPALFALLLTFISLTTNTRWRELVLLYALLSFSSYVQLVSDALASAFEKSTDLGAIWSAARAFRLAHLRLLMRIALCATNACMAMDALLTTLVRLATRRHLLQWTAVSQFELGAAPTRITRRYSSLVPTLVTGIFILGMLLRGVSFLIYLPLLLLWGSSVWLMRQMERRPDPTVTQSAHIEPDES